MRSRRNFGAKGYVCAHGASDTTRRLRVARGQLHARPRRNGRCIGCDAHRGAAHTDTYRDTDGDTLEDGKEVSGFKISLMGGDRVVQSDPSLVDSDGDGLSDDEELSGITILVSGFPRNVRTDPSRADTDGDGLFDKEEIDGIDIVVMGRIKTIVTDPTWEDTDADGLSDFRERE